MGGIIGDMAVHEMVVGAVGRDGWRRRYSAPMEQVQGADGAGVEKG